MMEDVGSFKTQESCQESSISIPKVNITGERQWVPRCLPELKPTKGMIFESLRECTQFYKKYADACGFQTRLSEKVMKKDVVKRRYMLCTRQGYRDSKGGMRNKNYETIDTSIANNKKRNRPLTRVGCSAKISFYLQKDGKYKVSSFVEEHTHKLISPISQYHLKRNLTTTHMHFIASNKRINKGGVTTYRFMKEVMGGYDNVGASKNACKNFVRKMKTQIGETDAQMLLDILKKRKLASKAFKYEFSEDEDKTLTRVFWADPIGQRNYAVFGDVMSFDTTYGSNKYSMIFCPFTGVDHHKRCVTFGAALLAKEDVEFFVWLFENFLQAMGGHQPSYLITDQDPAMEIAIKKVFTVSKHRFCMWHIMEKVPKKVPIDICRNPLFNSKINSCVWSEDMEPEEFEERWTSMIEELGLRDNDWLTHMFHIRHLWIPTYFRELFMGSLLRTISRSESENSFFGNFANPFLSLVELWASFESAMDAQRHIQSENDQISTTSFPELKTCFDLEHHASEIGDDQRISNGFEDQLKIINEEHQNILLLDYIENFNLDNLDVM